MDFYVKQESSIEIIKRFEKLIINPEVFQNAVITTVIGSVFVIDAGTENSISSQLKEVIDYFTIHPKIGIKEISFTSILKINNNRITFKYKIMDDFWDIISFQKNIGIPELLFEKTSESFDFCKKHKIISDSLPDIVKEQVLNYKNANEELSKSLSKLETLTANQVHSNSKYFNTIQTKMDTNFREKEEELNKVIDAKKVELKLREEELSKKIAIFNIKENKGVRRELLKEMRKAIDEHKEIELSTATVKKRKSVIWSCLVAMFIGLCLVGLSLYNIFYAKNDYSYILVPFSSGIILFSTTFIYFLRWSNSWVNKHTDAEFKNMQFSQDILRASWLAELVFEVGKESEIEVPAVLIEQFSKNLFENTTNEEKYHPLDDVFKLTKSFKKVKVGKAGIEVEQGNESK